MTVLRNTVLFFKFDPEDAFIKSVLIIHSVQFRHSVVSNSLQPHGRQHTRLSCTSPTPRACSNSCPCVMTSNQLILCHPLLLLPSVLPIIRVFSNESLCIRWPTYWSFSFSINPCNEYSGLISFKPHEQHENAKRNN